MKYVSSLCTALLLSIVQSSASAALQPMDNEQLSDTNGGTTGLQLALTMNINQDGAGGLSTACKNALQFCRVGIKINNQTDWILLKGFNGSINIPSITLYGATVTPTAGNPQSAIALKMSMNDTITITNLGYNLALGKAAGAISIPGATADQNIYLAAPVFYTSATSGSQYDLAGGPGGGPRETGILGININGQLKVGGTLFMFSK